MIARQVFSRRGVSYAALLALFGLLLASPALAQITPTGIAPANVPTAQTSAEAPDQFIERLVDRLRLLAMAQEDETTKKTEITAVLSEGIAVSRLRGFLLSREQRAKLTEAEIDQYNAIFTDYITAAFADSIDELVRRQISIRKVHERRPGDFIIRSKLITDNGEERASLDWRVMERRGTRKLVDVMIDGLSFNVERRAQFTAIMNKEGFPALLLHMQEVAGQTQG